MDMRRTLVSALINGSAGLYPAVRKSNGTRKRRRVKPVKRRAKAKSNGKRNGRLVKGSKAAKAYMAKIRRKRRR